MHEDVHAMSTCCDEMTNRLKVSFNSLDTSTPPVIFTRGIPFLLQPSYYSGLNHAVVLFLFASRLLRSKLRT